MKKTNIAFTWVWNDMVALELWCKYYSRYFEELFVLCCSTKPEYDEKLAEFKKKYNLTAERVDRDGDGDINSDVPHSKVFIKNKQVELLETHKWVLFSNCDELVITDPEYYADLKDFMKKCKKDWEWCLGYEVLQDDGEIFIDHSKPILKQRTSWLKNPYMNKVLIGKVPLSWNDGLHQIEETKNLEIVTMENHGLILLHLKHMDFDAPDRDLIRQPRPRYGYVMEKFASRDQMPEWVREVM